MSDTSINNPSEGIAIIGMAGRFPGADGIDAFWRNLKQGVESITRFADAELEVNGPETRDPNYVKARGVLDNVDMFDAAFFGLTPKEAAQTDPQHRLFLECAWEAFEHGGYDSERYSGSVGVFAGCSMNTYLLANLCQDRAFIEGILPYHQIGAQAALLGNDKDFLATRVSYKLNLRGPSMVVQSACSTSLVAICQACQSLMNFQCDMALAGGVSISFPQRRGYLYQEGGLASKDGHCRAFDAMAEGTIFGGGVGVVLLKRLSEAILDGDHIHAVIKGFALNNDGAAKVSYMAPSIDGQAEVIASAQAQAGISADTISYVETHGTGTPLGDPIEIAGLTKAFRLGTDRNGFCAIGSVKTNVGHLESAAGVAGLIKTVLALQNRQLPPSLHYATPNPAIDFSHTPFYVNSCLSEWKQNGHPLRAGVSSFGVGGTNAHVVLEEAPISKGDASHREAQILILSARSEGALEAQTERLSAFLKENNSVPIADLAYTLQVGRRQFNHRRILTANSPADAVEQLEKRDPKRFQTSHAERRDPPVVFMFPGQGAQTVNMGRALYECEPVFRSVLDECCTVLQHDLGLDLRQILYPPTGEQTAALHKLTETWITQPALFVVEYALARLWMSWGVKPAAMIGHSVGEYVAATLSGVFELTDGLHLLAARARMMQDLPGGSMLAIRAPEADVLPLLGDELSLAAVNAPSSCVVSGPSPAILNLQARLKEHGVAARTLATSHAFHSSMMDTLCEPFTALVARTVRGVPRIPYIANATSQWMTAEDAGDATYWFNHLRRPVRFADGLVELAKDPNRILLEVGPGQTLATLARQNPSRPKEQIVVSSMPSSGDDGEVGAMLSTLGQLWLAGVTVDWPELYHGEKRLRLPLPTYPFERKRFWVEAPKSGTSVALPDMNETPARQSSTPSVSEPVVSTAAASLGPVAESTRKERVLGKIKSIFQEVSGSDQSQVDPSVSFLELGYDSLFLTQTSQALQSQLGVKITFRQMLEDVSTYTALTDYILEKLPPDAFAPESQPAKKEPEILTRDAEKGIASMASGNDVSRGSVPSIPCSLPAGPSGNGSLQQVIQQQLDIMRQQLAMLQGGTMVHLASTSVTPVAAKTVPKITAAPMQPVHNFGPFKPIERGAAGGLTERQQKCLDALVARYNHRTAESKRLTQLHRPHFCDPRAAGNFRQLWKEMVYPIVSKRSAGARIWDVDGNEYVDVTLGFGVHFLGHSPEFVVKALQEQMQMGFELGPQSRLAGEVAQMVGEMTGMDRVTFCNTGSEAVMAAIRVTRTVTGRNKFVFFSGDYHGIFDEVLVRQALLDGQPGAAPIAPGIPSQNLGNVILLEYGNPASLETLKGLLPDVAAVIVEPVQARHPDLQPREFLHELRRMTEASGTALVMDEVITGFRVLPGGAQEYFGVQADMATYGKIVGGGMPIGVLAGKRKFMDALDGGMWNYGDASYPEVGVTFFAGTFVRHPLAMAAAHAVMRFLKQSGPSLQENLNRRTALFTSHINTFFEERRLPMRLQTFSSLFYYDFHPDLKYAGLLFYFLRDRGVHIWEGRVGFFSIAHTDEDIAFVEKAFRESVLEMQEGGLLPESDGVPPNTGTAGSTPATVPSNSSAVAGGGAQPSSMTGSKQLPLTESQMEMWLAATMSPEASAAYNESCALHLRGNLNVEQLNAALHDVINAHEALRTTFDVEGRHQIIAPRLDLEMPLRDFTNLAPSERDIHLQSLLDQEGRNAFDLVKGPLLRLQLVRLEPAYHVLVTTVHHIVCDGWSYDVFLNELGACYSARLHGRKYESANRMSFSEYQKWQMQQQQSPEAVAAEAYWQAQYADIPAMLELPIDHPRSAVRTFRARRLCASLEPALMQGLRKVASRCGCTQFVLLMVAFKVLLHRLSGQEDLVVGFPVAGQMLAGNKDLIGHCVNLLPLRSHVDGQQPFDAYLGTLKKVLLDACEHQNYTFGTLVKKLELPRDSSRVPLIGATFNIDPPMTGLCFEGLEHTLRVNPRSFYNFDFEFNLVEEGGGLEVECSFSTDLFDDATIHRWLKHWKYMLAAIVDHPQTSIDKLPLLDEGERKLVVEDWNQTQTKVSGPQCIHEWVERQAASSPNQAAVVSTGRSLTYDELDGCANQLAHHLQALGAGTGERIAVLLERSCEMPLTLLGVAKTGAAYVPLDPSYPVAAITSMLADIGPKALVTRQSLADRLPDIGVPVIRIDADWSKIAEHPRHRPGTSVKSSDAVYIIYTSGSTGKPKGVEIVHAGLVNLVAWHQRVFQCAEGDRFSQIASPAFDAAAWEIWSCLALGGTLCIPEENVRGTPRMLLDWLKTHRIAYCFMPTPMMEACFKEQWNQGFVLKSLFVGGDELRQVPAVDLPCPLYNLYGPTENTVISTFCKVTGDSDQHRSIIGRPIDNSQAYVLDPYLQPQPIGVAGELHVSGMGVSRGYFKRPELTAGKFVPHPFIPGERLYKTGDLARLLADGRLEFLGRIDHQVKIRGFRVELGEIESVLAQHQSVREAHVSARHENSRGKQLVAYIVSKTTEGESGVESAAISDREVQWETQYKKAIERADSSLEASSDPSLKIYEDTGLKQTDEEVASWVANTVERIRNLHPKRVLELGCGTGLVTLKLAPCCEEYWASDFSQAAVRNLERRLESNQQMMPNIHLFTQAANDFRGVPQRYFDVVVLNSVVEYLTSAAYLVAVLEGAIQVLGDGGVVFLGDVPNLWLQRVFHTSEQMHLASPDTSMGVLISRVHKRIAQDKRLLVAPEFFLALQRRLPDITHVEFRLMRGRLINELTRIHAETHYDVLLHVRSRQSKQSEAIEWLDQWAPDALRARLSNGTTTALGVSGFLHKRINGRIRAYGLMEGETVKQAGEMMGLVRSLEDGVDPEDIWRLGDELGCLVDISWLNHGKDGRCEAIFRPKNSATHARSMLPFHSSADHVTGFHSLYASNPLQARLASDLTPKLRNYLEQRLPSYMVPSAFVFVEALPLTVNGKVDEKNLPEPPLDFQEQKDEFVPARDALEIQLVKIWQEVLGVKGIGVRDNFFNLGGHSLLAVRLFSQIEKLTGKVLPISTLFQAPTIESLARILANDKWSPPWSPLVPIKPQGVRPPFYCVHGAGGNILEFNHMARYIPDSLPLYGIQAQGLDGKLPWLSRVEDMAALYIKEITAFQPQGPYYLGGSSFGGLVAYEMACQMRAIGLPIGLLALFDTGTPDYPQYLPSTTVLQRKWNNMLQRIKLHWGNLRDLEPQKRWEYIHEKAGKVGNEWHKRARRAGKWLTKHYEYMTLPPAIRDVRKSGHQASQTYDPKPYDGKVTLFRATEQPRGIIPDPTLGWGRLVRGPLEIIEVPGHHGSLIREPRVRILVARLVEALTKVQEQENAAMR